MQKRNYAVTLLELLIALVLLSLVVLGFTSLHFFSHSHVISADRRARIQNDLSFILEDISRNIIRATGDRYNPAIRDLRPATVGFSVRVDNNNPATPGNYADDTVVTYRLNVNRIEKQDSATAAFLALVPHDLIPNTAGFAFQVLDNGAGIEVTLMGREVPGQAESVDNPQIQVRTQIYSHSASTH